MSDISPLGITNAKFKTRVYAYKTRVYAYKKGSLDVDTSTLSVCLSVCLIVFLIIMIVNFPSKD